MNEIRTLLNEPQFTNLCKNGFIRHRNQESRTSDINFTTEDIRNLCKGEIIEKNDYSYGSNGDIFKYALQDLGYDLIKEILKRSPIFSHLADEIPTL